MLYDLDIEELGGNCPVQATGTIKIPDEDQARFWYFRARGQAWSLEIWAPGVEPSRGYPSTLPEEKESWSMHTTWPAGEFLAGWMPNEAAKKLIEHALDVFALSLQYGKKQDKEIEEREEKERNESKG